MSSKTPRSVSEPKPSVIKRSDVPAGKAYGEYREYLRHDFFHSCAYCTMSEVEAAAIGFAIDHYEPKRARPDIENDYSNLMYSCEECNTYKGDRYPPLDARAAGNRFFRPDQDAYEDHFELQGRLLRAKTPVGDYNIEAIDLNRQTLRRVREIRERFHECRKQVMAGILSLRGAHLDQLPQHLKGRALRAIGNVETEATRIMEEIDDLLREHAKSPLIDPDPEAEKRAEERARRLRQKEALFPGIWRARDVPK